MSSGPAIDEQIQPPKRRRAWIPPFGVWQYAIVGAILLTPFFVRGWFLSQVPEISVPFDVDEFCHVVIPSGQNAFDHYREALRLKESIERTRSSQNVSEPYDDWSAVIANGWIASDALKQWLIDVRPALLEWRRGTELTESLLVPLHEMDDRTSLGTIQSFRSFARFAACEGRRAEAENDFVEAGNWYIATLRCGQHSSHHGCIIGCLVGYAVLSLGSDRLIQWAENPEVTLDELRRVQDQIRTIDQTIVETSETLKVEYLYAINSLKRSDWWESIDGISGSGVFEQILSANSDYNPLPSCIIALYWTLGEPLRTQRLLRHALTNQLREVDKPISKRRPSAETTKELLFQPDPEATHGRKELQPADIDYAIQHSLISKDFLPLLRNVDVAMTTARARKALLEIAVAAQVYCREHGEFPHDPRSLVPKYLEQWPADPWDKTGQSIRYRRDDAASAVVWSVGQNFTDEGGDVSNENFQYLSLDYGIRLKTR